MNRFCTKCGKELIEGTKFCTNCGAKIDDMQTDGINQEKSAQEENPQRQIQQLNNKTADYKNRRVNIKIIIVLLILLIVCLIVVPIVKNVLTTNSYKKTEQQSDNKIAQTTAENNIDYSKYIGTYTVKSEEGTKHELTQTLTVKKVDGKTIEFEYTYTPPRHEVTMTATQGSFVDSTTALADGTYDIDGQLKEIAYKFKFNEDSIECKFYDPGEEDSVEYTTFNLSTKNNNESKQKTDDCKVVDTSTGTENAYTEIYEKVTGRQFKMTIEEFVEKHNQMVQNNGYAEKEEQDKRFKWDDVAFYEYPISLDNAIVDETKVDDKDVISYKFTNVSKNYGVDDSTMVVDCYKDTQKIFMIDCVVTDKWFQNDAKRWIKKDPNHVENLDDYDNLPARFGDFALNESSIINPKLNSFVNMIEEVGSSNINFKDNVIYQYHSYREDNGTVFHILRMYASDKSKTLRFKK